MSDSNNTVNTDDAPTKRDQPSHFKDSPTRRDGDMSSGDAATRRDNEAGLGNAATLRDQYSQQPTRFVLTLPPQLEETYDYVRDLPASGSEAELAVLQDKKTGEQVMLKKYRLGITPDFSVMEKLYNGDPEYFVRLISYHDDSDGTWEIQEYCQLGSLKDWLDSRGGRLDKSMLSAALSEIATALNSLQDFKIVHRDLKPANVLVRSEAPLDLVLSDFGLSKTQDFSVMEGGFRGTCFYAAPEVYSGVVSAKSDWFSLGAMIYELYTGRRLFALADGSPVSEMDAHTRCLQGNYSTELIDDERWSLLADGLLTYDKDYRWGFEQVELWLNGESPEVYRSKTPGQSAGAGRRLSYRPSWSPTLVATPAELAEELRKHWDDAATELAGRPDGEMIRFLEGHVGMDEAVRIVNSSAAPGPKLVSLQVILDPDTAPVFDGVSLDDISIQAQIKQADSGDKVSLNWLSAVLDEKILTAFATATGSKVVAQADYELSKYKQQADEAIKLAPSAYRSLGYESFRAYLPKLFAEALRKANIGAEV